ncbi:capsular polysaccharide biosynthesis protein [Kordiimonas pumila]|uniref:Capsular polysaccharide biosynthesis protein n=1 Tax=Kordiimonas pumila TaxID=2161677 RepID=A0ABV7D4N8_9PROT|nr:capsular polysaccharide biosynthesis protein [Kordiimonas pumila]
MSDDKIRAATGPKALTSSRGIAGDKAMAALLGRPVKLGLSSATPADVVVGWGQKDNTEKARLYAKKNGLPYWRLEDGFIGYLSHPAIDKRRLSLIIDTTGIYYDAHSPSDLENMLNQDDWITPDLIERAETAMARMRRWRISKYNQSPAEIPAWLQVELAAYKGPKVLVVDQTFGDKSITDGMASDDMFRTMLEDALAENPTALVLVKVHPDVMLGQKRGHYDPERVMDRVLFVADDVAPQSLIEKVDQVYVVTSQMGFEGLIAGKKVSCYGLPFYAGWGLTHDKQLCEARIANRSLAELFAAAYMLYTVYNDPYTGKRVEIERILDLLVAERQMARPRAQRTFAVGFSLWKRGFIPEFLGVGAGTVQFIKPAVLAALDYKEGDMVVLWGRKHDTEAAVIPAHVPVWRMEDGFLRSVGLGSDLRRPSSLVLDRTGIYYDGTAPSDLESFLAAHKFDDADIARGERLRHKIRSARVSKYNVGEHGALNFREAAGKREVILVPGQVEADASIQYGSPTLKTNAGLLEAVKAAKPDAYIIYKPHPDVVSGNRAGDVPQTVLAQTAQEVITEADIIDVLEAVDSVHTMTSLTGFEALISGKNVTTYGMPFYAGWGLTTDMCSLPRRGRKLSLDALVYALYCVYARYVRWPEGASYSPEALVEELARTPRGGPIAAGPFAPVTRLGRKAKYFLDAMRR